MDVKNIKIQDFTYDLPDNRIAKYPLAERDNAKLLIFKDGKISENIYRNIAQVIDNESLVLFNNTKVIPARLFFKRATGALIEIFCLEPIGELATGMAQTETATWLCFVGNAKKWKDGEILTLAATVNGEKIVLSAVILKRERDGLHITFNWAPPQYLKASDVTFAQILAEIGEIPLPPYLNREVEADDKNRYQTIYARFDGSVAAPTAGLHFTDAIFEDFDKKNIQKAFVTLHVGAGTFKPVKSETLADHDMHAEYLEVSRETLKILRGSFEKNKKRNVIAVGTTTLRTLESIFLLGSKMKNTLLTKNAENPSGSDFSPSQLVVNQWEAYQNYHETTSVEAALDTLLEWLDTHNLEKIVAKTQLLIAPPYRVRMVDALVTNFHQPQSTLLLLVSAMVGDAWRDIYDYALTHDFRFLSYGDGSVLFKRF